MERVVVAFNKIDLGVLLAGMIYMRAINEDGDDGLKIIDRIMDDIKAVLYSEDENAPEVSPEG